MGQNISLHRIFKKINIVRLARPSLALALGLACQKTAVFHAALQKNEEIIKIIINFFKETLPYCMFKARLDCWHDYSLDGIDQA